MRLYWALDSGGWSFLFNGIANLLLFLAYAFGSEVLTLGIAFSSWVIALPASAILVALMFRKALTAE